jgi:hypothetical protein
MESVATRSATSWFGTRRGLDREAVGIWALAVGLVLYLAFDGGGYDTVVSSQAGLVVWWIVLVGAACGVLPRARLSRVAWGALGLLAAFVAWTALASTWSLSSERSLQDLSLVSVYLGVLLLAVVIHRDRQRAVRHTVYAVGLAVAAVAVFAVISRLVPTAFPASHVTSSFLGGAQGRLSWPLNYWNGLAALVALGLPLLLSIVTSARSLLAQALAAAALPVLALCEFLTFSRGGLIATGVALLVFLLLAPDRFPKLATMLVGAAGSAVLIEAAVHRHAIDQGLTNQVAVTQGREILIAVGLVCLSGALAQVGIGLAARHGTLPASLRLSRRSARRLLAGAVAVLVIAGLIAGGPSRLEHGWRDFKAQSPSVRSDLPSRLGSVSGNGRYSYWNVGVQATGGHVLDGSGPGTFQLLWQPRAPIAGYIVNAHSLYVETLAEVGVVGLVLLLSFFALVVGAAVRLVARSEDVSRARAAGVAAALLAFMVSAIFDWVWQLPVLPAAFLLLAAAVLAPASKRVLVRVRASEERGRTANGRRSLQHILVRVGLAAGALGCLAAIGIPLATASAVRQSQAAVDAGKTSFALMDVRTAARLEPGAASPQLQLALVLELQHQYPAALAAAQRAVANEPQNWSEWLVLSRLQAETGHVNASIASYRRARSLNPRSSLFRR